MIDSWSRYLVGIVKRGVATANGEPPAELMGALANFGTRDAPAAVEALHSSLTGLAEEDARGRLKAYGPNEVAHEKPPAWPLQLLQSFNNSFILVLVVIGVASYFTDVFFARAGARDWTNVLVIATMALVSVLLRFSQEFRSSVAAEKLRTLVQNRALVLRRSWDGEDAVLVEGSPTEQSGDKRELAVSHIVPGDIVYLSAGDMVPADLRLLSSKDLFVSQSALTGESMPVEKYATLSEVSEVSDAPAPPGAGASEAASPFALGTLCLMGTNVVSGTASGVVVATGNRTYFGSLARRIVGRRSLSSFDRGINRVSVLLISFMAVMVPLVFVLNGLTKGVWQEAFLFALAVAVGLTPEMLPTIVTANLARGAVALSRQKVIVKKLDAIQNFGAMDVLCTDKTGTLTENRIVLVRHLDPTGRESERVLSLAYLNSYFQTGLKSLMDAAILEKKEKEYPVAEERGYRKVDEIPFDFTRRRMSVVVEKGDRHLLVCKGALAEVLAASSRVEEGGQVLPISEEIRERVRALAVGLNQEGLRTIAVAYKPVSERKHFYAVKDECDLVLAGYIGFLDPPKASAKDAIRRLERHGVEVKIITGDNEVVTKRICKEVRLKEGKVLLGNEVDALADDELARAAEATTIFARAEPLQKARIVEALKAAGHTVGFLGDGVNDAAALRAADVGISVNTGVDIAKEAADIILLENDLGVLERGVMGGRLVFGNIMKYLKMATSSNFGNVLSILLASAVLPFLPLRPIQVLVQNLLTDFSQVSIPWDTVDASFLEKPRAWLASGIARFMLFVGPVSSLFDVATFAVLWFVFKANVPGVQSLFQSGWFVEGLLTQTLIIHIIRTEKIPFVESRATAPVLLLTAVIMLVGLALPFTGIGAHLGLSPLPLAYFPWLVATTVGYAFLTQLVKRWYLARFGGWL